jgi:hypothetical protein
VWWNIVNQSANLLPVGRIAKRFPLDPGAHRTFDGFCKTHFVDFTEAQEREVGVGCFSGATYYAVKAYFRARRRWPPALR